MKKDDCRGKLQAEGGYCQVVSDSRTYVDLSSRETGLAKPSILLHSCCGPCSTTCLERLTERYQVTVYFYNPNITDEGEYALRRETQLKVIRCFNEDLAYDARVDFLEGPYDPERYLDLVAGLEDAPEGGARCGSCFTMRLAKTAQTAGLMGYEAFTTTLTVSPHKDSETIFAIGRRLALQYDVPFLEENFKKRNGFGRSVELSRKYGLYRQDYCGCRFSAWPGCHVGGKAYR